MSKKTHSGVTSPSLDDCPAREEDRASENCLHSMKLVVVNDFLCSSATMLENSLDDTKQVCQVGTLSVECCSKSKFPHEGNSGLILTSRGTLKKVLVVLLSATYKTIPRSCVPNSTECFSRIRCECK
jgi:hypothetical protein